jgi:hypothetical protein
MEDQGTGGAGLAGHAPDLGSTAMSYQAFRALVLAGVAGTTALFVTVASGT